MTFSDFWRLQDDGCPHAHEHTDFETADDWFHLGWLAMKIRNQFFEVQ